jgi:quercetin dioxygenase-like cupin family protein
MSASAKISLDEKFAAFSEHWRPKTIAAVNDQEVKIVKVQGTFTWHQHEKEDEFFLVWKGRFCVEFRDRVVELGPGEEHRTCADQEAEILIFEPVSVINTGNVVDEVYTAPQGVHV